VKTYIHKDFHHNPIGDDSVSRIYHAIVPSFVHHGECMTFTPIGNIDERYFAIEGKLHGELIHNYGLHKRQFYMRDIVVSNFPFLPDKPMRKDYKSERNRFTTLEV